MYQGVLIFALQATDKKNSLITRYRKSIIPPSGSDGLYCWSHLSFSHTLLQKKHNFLEVTFLLGNSVRKCMKVSIVVVFGTKASWVLKVVFPLESSIHAMKIKWVTIDNYQWTKCGSEVFASAHCLLWMKRRLVIQKNNEQIIRSVIYQQIRKTFNIKDWLRGL